MKVYPIGLVHLQGRRCVVVGGGAVAERKVAGLLEVGAHVQLISPAVTAALQAEVSAARVVHVARHFQPGDLEGAWLAIAATDEPAVNAAVWWEGEARGVLVNAIDDVAHSHFIAPAVHGQGDLTLAVFTGGRSPALAALIRDSLRAIFGPEYGELAELLGAARPRLKDLAPEQRSAVAGLALELGIRERLRAGDRNGALAVLDQAIEAARAWKREP